MARQSGLRKPKKRGRRLAIWVILFAAIVFFGWKVLEQQGILGSIKETFDSSRSDAPFEGATVRGTIFDRNYKELAVSLERVSVYVRTRELESREKVALLLSPVLEIDEDVQLEKLKGESLRIWLLKNISQQQEDKVRELDLAGVYLFKDYLRFYPQKTTAAHLVGFVEDDIGLAGVEYYYDRLTREVLAVENEGGYTAAPGQHVLLTIDLKIQEILEELVREVSGEHPRARIGAYAMDAGSGALVASVQTPSYNPNTYRLYSQDILYSLCLKPMLVPSAFRSIFHEAAAIKSQYDARGKVHPWSVAVKEQSLGTELRLWEALGLEEKAPVEFENEAWGEAGGVGPFTALVQSRSDFGTVSELLTPLNVLKGLSSLMNGGKKVEPHVVGSMVEADSGEMHPLHGSAGEGGYSEVVSADVSREISQLVGALAVRDELGGVTVQDSVMGLEREGKYWKVVRNEVYFAAVPSESAELTLLLTIQDDGVAMHPEPKEKKSVYPGDLLAAVIPRIAVLQQVGKSISDIAEPEQTGSINYPKQLDSIRDELQFSLLDGKKEVAAPSTMPELIGLSLRKSLRLLQGTRCRIRVYGTGKVVAQEPKAGTELMGEMECVLKLQQEDVTLEKMEGKTAD